MPADNHFLSTITNEHWPSLSGLFFSLLTIFFHFNGNPYLATLFAALSIAFFSISVSEVADILAERLEEPYGTFVLTFSAVGVEVILLFMVLLEASHNPLALDTVKGGIISAVIVDMNVLLGLAVFIGGLAFKEQTHNEDTSGTYTTILLVSATALLVPSVLKFTNNSESLFVVSALIALALFLFYIIIFIFQTKTHSHYFKATARSRMFKFKRRGSEDEEGVQEDLYERLPTYANFLILFFMIAFIGVLAEIFASEGMSLVSEYHIPVGLAGLIIAIISVSPEIVTAVNAAKNDQIQRVVNIAMGASTVSILFTVPMILALAYFNGIRLSLDFNTLQIGALLLTVVLAWKTTDDGHTNYFEGSSHLMFFLCYAIVAAFY